MDRVLKLVKTYRVTSGLIDRLQLAEELFRLIEPDLRLFVVSSVRREAVDDVMQESLKAIAGGLGGFKGGTEGEFWAWCYQILRFKMADHVRKQGYDHLQPLPDEELCDLLEASAQNQPISAADRLDLEHAMQLLKASKPECTDFLWKHFILGFAYGEIAAECKLGYDTVRMKIGRCLKEASSLMA